MSQEKNNKWAVLLCSSRYWFNYRHVANTLSMYHIIKTSGIPDNNIILMVANDSPCNSRNPFPGKIFKDENIPINFFDDSIEIDYSGEDVNPTSFLNLLSGKQPFELVRTKRLDTDADSKVIIYMTGHGGDEFFKFHDHDELSAQDLSNVIIDMEINHRFKEIFLIIDTCQAATMTESLISPNVITISSSMKGQNSYSYHPHKILGLPVMDRFTFSLHTYFEKNMLTHLNKSSKKNQRQPVRLSLQNLMDSLDSRFLLSTPSTTNTIYNKSLHEISLTHFFSFSYDFIMIPFYEEVEVFTSITTSTSYNNHKSFDESSIAHNTTDNSTPNSLPDDSLSFNDTKSYAHFDALTTSDTVESCVKLIEDTFLYEWHQNDNFKKLVNSEYILISNNINNINTNNYYQAAFRQFSTFLIFSDSFISTYFILLMLIFFLLLCQHKQ